MDNNILQNLATKEDISNVEKCLKLEINKVTAMLERLDQERIFTNRNVGRHEE